MSTPKESYASLALMYGLAASMSGGFAPMGQRFVPIDPEEAEKRRERKIKASKPQLAKAKGLKEFVFEDGSIFYAINYKNALKKHLNSKKSK
jgi:pyoverdine/dityrosine biosynthesis protein Dit1